MRAWTDEQLHAMGYIACYGPSSANEIAAELYRQSPKYDECENALAQALIDAQAACLLLLAYDLIYPYNVPFEYVELEDGEHPAFEAKGERFHAAHAEAAEQYTARIHQGMVDRGILTAN